MSGKIILITPPDIYENDTKSVLFVHINDQDQETVSRWIADKQFDHDINFYLYNGESDVPWILWASASCQHKYIDLDQVNEISQALSGYLLGKGQFTYKTTNENLAAVYSHINNNRVTEIEQFLERALGDQNN